MFCSRLTIPLLGALLPRPSSASAFIRSPVRHSTVLNLSRTRSDTVLPLSEPITGIDGSKIREVHVPKDTTIIVGILSSNRNKAIWGEDALEWKPERWLNPLPKSVTEAKIPGIQPTLYARIQFPFEITETDLSHTE